MASNEAWVELAFDQYNNDGVLEVPTDAKVDEVDDGAAWVSAWVWVEVDVDPDTMSDEQFSEAAALVLSVAVDEADAYVNDPPAVSRGGENGAYVKCWVYTRAD